jgi:hypothetical protein
VQSFWKSGIYDSRDDSEHQSSKEYFRWT